MEAVRSTVAGVTVSVTLAVAVPLPTVRLSKLPPETPVMCAVRLEASYRRPRRCPRQWSSVPVVAPSAMVISPWSVWMVVTPSEAFDSVAVNT